MFFLRFSEDSSYVSDISFLLDATHLTSPPRSGLTWFCFLFPLIEPERRASRIRLSEKGSPRCQGLRFFFSLQDRNRGPTQSDFPQGTSMGGPPGGHTIHPYPELSRPK